MQAAPGLCSVILVFLAAMAGGGHAQELPPLDKDLIDPSLPIGKLMVREIRFEGNTVISDAELGKSVTKYVGRELTTEQLEEARREATLLYVNRGYINSGAIIPDQDVRDGVLVLRIIEGKLTDFRPIEHEAATRPATQPATRPI